LVFYIYDANLQNVLAI